MNKRLQIEFGPEVTEQRGWHWTLTNFAFETWWERQSWITVFSIPTLGS
jgi:hypothetical protein